MTDIKLSEIVESNYWRYDLHSACVKGENNDPLHVLNVLLTLLEKSPDLAINRRKYGGTVPPFLSLFFES